MEETKTAEEIYLDSLNLPITNSATRLFWEETLRVFKEQQLTQQQSANAELQNKFDNLLSVYDLSKKHVEELKKQKAELVEALKEAPNHDHFQTYESFILCYRKWHSKILNTPPKN